MPEGTGMSMEYMNRNGRNGKERRDRSWHASALAGGGYMAATAMHVHK